MVKELFSCAVAFRNDCAIAYLCGELDMSTADCVKAPLVPLAVAGWDIVLELSNLTFVGTAGLRALADIQESAAAAGGSTRMAEVPDIVRRLLSVTGMEDRFAIAAHTT